MAGLYGGTVFCSHFALPGSRADVYYGSLYEKYDSASADTAIGEANHHKSIERGIGIILSPFNPNGKATISNLGQRQAILYDLSTILGVFRDDGDPALVPLAKLDIRDGRLAIFLLPHEKNEQKAVEIVLRVPILESAVRMPTEAKVNAQKGN